MNLFFEFIQLSLGKRDSFCLCPNEREWGELFELAKKQALVGVLFSGVERLPEEQRPPKDVLLKWYALVQKIEERNRVLNRQVVAVSERFMRDGFCSCIMKGQGNAALYSNPLRRQSGDIDIWLDGGRKKIMKYIKPICPSGEVRYHHVDFPVVKDVSIEVHFTPSYLHNPLCNRRLQRWFKRESAKQFTNKIDVKDVGVFNLPTLEFNIIYQLVHIFNHLFDEGIGLRQMMDYYLICSCRSRDDYELRIMNDEVIELLKSLKLYKFAGAVMWVLGEVFGLERDLMYVEPDEKEGRFLLDEIMLAGNFGHHDPRYGDLKNESRGHKFVRKLKRNFRFIRRYPSEVLWEPVFRVWHFVWRGMIKN